MESGIRAQQIFNAIDAGHRTVGGLCTRLNVIRDHMVEDLDYLVETKQLKRFEQGTIVAYFRHDENPVHVRLNGGGIVHAEFAEDADDLEDLGNVKPPHVDPKTVEQFASEGKSARELAEHCGVKLASLKNYLANPSARDLPVAEAWKRGKQLAIDNGVKLGRSAPKMRRETTNGHVPSKPTPKVKAPEPIAQISTSSEEPKDATPKSVHSRYVTLERGGQILVAYEGIIFDLTASERELIGELADVLTKFEEAKTA
jgi:hypothetical protein